MRKVAVFLCSTDWDKGAQNEPARGSNPAPVIHLSNQKNGPGGIYSQTSMETCAGVCMLHVSVLKEYNSWSHCDSYLEKLKREKMNKLLAGLRKLSLFLTIAAECSIQPCCTQYGWSSAFPSHHRRILASLSPNSSLPHCFASLKTEAAFLWACLYLAAA